MPYETHLTVAPEHAARAHEVTRLRFVSVINYPGAPGLPGIPDCFSAAEMPDALSLAEIRKVLDQQSEILLASGVPVLRWKIETEAHNFGVGHSYWETCLRVAGNLENAVERVSGLYSFDPVRDRHWWTVRSRRVGDEMRAGVIGDVECVDRHRRFVHHVVRNLIDGGAAVCRPPEAEAVVLDTAPGHDARWERGISA